MAKPKEKAPNEGCRLLRASGLSLSVIGGIAGKTKPAAAKWMRGGKPDDEARIALELDPRTRIPRDAWDRAAGTLGAVPTPAPTPAPVEPPPPPEPPPGLLEQPPAPPPWSAPGGYTPPPLPPRPPEPPPPAPYEPSDVALDAPGAARALVIAQLKRLSADTARLRSLTGHERASEDAIRKAEEAERKAYLDLAKLAGELNPTEEARLVKSVKWYSIREGILKALEPYPDALKAVVATLASEGA